MTTAEAQKLMLNFMEDWANTHLEDFVSESIIHSGDADALAALEQVGFDFDWKAQVTVD